MKQVMTDESKTTLCFASSAALTGPGNSKKLQGLQYTTPGAQHKTPFIFLRYQTQLSQRHDMQFQMNTRGVLGLFECFETHTIL